MSPKEEFHESSLPPRLGPYRIKRRLGQGGQGAVFLAEDLKLRRDVALKILPPAFAASADACLRLEREAETTARVNHPAIARIHEIGEHETYLFLAMEYIEGKTLSTCLEEARRAGEATCDFESRNSETIVPGSDSQRSSDSKTRLPRLIKMFETIARGLHAAHEKGLVHRDLKPGNIMIRPNGDPVVIDFGLAQDQKSEGVTLTATGQILGTPAYMSPEQVRGHRGDLDRRSDVYSLGATLFECCTLSRPFEAPSRHELMRAIAQDAPLRPRNLNNRLPADLEAIILTAIDRDPKRRYQSAAEFADDLSRFLNHEPVHARRIGPALRSMRWVRRNSLLTTTIAVIFLALASVAWIFAVKSHEAELALQRAEKSNREKTAALIAERQARFEKEQALADHERLADVTRLSQAIARADTLFPPSAELIPELEAYLEGCAEFERRLEEHRNELDELRARALPYTEEEKRRDFETEYADLERFRAAVEIYDGKIAAHPDQEMPERIAKRLAGTRERIEELETKIATERVRWTFADETDQFKHHILVDLVADLDHFLNDPAGSRAAIARRLDQSRAIVAETIERHAESWETCLERIRQNELYDGLSMPPQVGLIPLGPDPSSGLEEFLHWLSHAGEIPSRDGKTGQLARGVETGIVLVLVPGGRFRMGAQDEDAELPNFDPEAKRDEQPTHELSVEPYLLSKYEMTQGQWQQSFGLNPSRFHPGFHHKDLDPPTTLRHPVETVSWNDCRLYLPRIGLELPTEAEWERAARAGRQDQVYAGTSSLSELADFANIAGAETIVLGSKVSQEDYRDDHVVHAPVGSLRPNAFGLHDMTGNVWEWCLDAPQFHYRIKPGQRGLRSNPIGTHQHVARGGSFNIAATHARLSHRFPYSAGEKGNALGVRPIWLIRSHSRK